MRFIWSDFGTYKIPELLSLEVGRYSLKKDQTSQTILMYNLILLYNLNLNLKYWFTERLSNQQQSLRPSIDSKGAAKAFGIRDITQLFSKELSWELLTMLNVMFYVEYQQDNVYTEKLQILKRQHICHFSKGSLNRESITEM